MATGDGIHQIIVAVGVSNQASDRQHLLPMLERIVASTGQLPDKMIANADYCTTESQAQSSWRGHAAAGFAEPAPVRWPTPLPLLI